MPKCHIWGGPFWTPSLVCSKRCGYASQTKKKYSRAWGIEKDSDGCFHFRDSGPVMEPLWMQQLHPCLPAPQPHRNGCMTSLANRIIGGLINKILFCHMDIELVVSHQNWSKGEDREKRYLSGNLVDLWRTPSLSDTGITQGLTVGKEWLSESHK